MQDVVACIFDFLTIGLIDINQILTLVFHRHPVRAQRPQGHHFPLVPLDPAVGVSTQGQVANQHFTQFKRGHQRIR